MGLLKQMFCTHEFERNYNILGNLEELRFSTITGTCKKCGYKKEFIICLPIK